MMPKLAQLTPSIVRPLNQISSRGHNFSRVFSDWLALSTHALAGEEESYMEVMRQHLDNRPQGERNADLFAEAFGAWQLALKTKYRDYLGEIFEVHVTRGENGQFFTPESLCQLMAQITMPDFKDSQSVCDPAVGSGRNLIAATRINRKGRFFGGDIDINCVRMTAMNLLCRNVEGAVLHADAIRLEAYGGYRLRSGPWGGVLETMAKDEAQQLLEGPFKKAIEKPRDAVSAEAANDNEPEQEFQIDQQNQYGFEL